MRVVDFPRVAVDAWLKVAACKMTIVSAGNRWRVSSVENGVAYIRVSKGPHVANLVAAIESLAEAVALARRARAS